MATTTFEDYNAPATYQFSFPSIQESDIKVSVDGDVKTSGTHYNITGYTTTGGGTVVFIDNSGSGGTNHTPSSPSTVRVFRDTDVDNAKATYTAGSSVKAADLNANHEQLMFAAQEEQNQTIDTNRIKDTAVTTDKLRDLSVTTAKIADNAITTAKINADAINGTKIADDSINSEHYVDGSIDTAHIADSQITTAKIANSAVTNDKIANATIATEKYVTGSVSGTVLANGAVTEPKIQDGSVTTAKLTSDAVTTIKIANGAVTNAKLASNAVTTSGIADSQITTAKIANSAVTNDKIADGTIATAKYVDGSITTAKIGNGQVIEPKIVDGAVTTPKLADAELRTLAGMQSGTASKLADSTALTADIADLNQIDGMQKATTVTDDDTKFPTSGAIVDYVAAQLEPFGGFEAIANESSFPNTQPASGVAISIADAGGMTVSSSGTASGATVGGTTVNISGIPSNFFSSTVSAGVRFIVTSTGSGQNYTYHKATLKEDDLLNLSGDINDFSERYRVGSSNPTTSLDSGDLFFNTGTGKLLVYNGTNSAWEEAQSVGNFFINTISSSSATGGGSATPNGTAYRFTLSNAGTNAEQHLVSVDGVVQKPNSGSSQPSEGFAVSGADIIFGSAPVSGASIFVITIGSTVNIGTPSNNTVNSAILQNGSVTTAKIVDANVTTDKIANSAVTNAKVASDAAIAGTKISPDFGSQNIVTSGSVTADDITIERPTGNLSANFKATNGLGTLEIGGSTGAFIDLKTPFSDDFDFRINHDGVMTSAAGGSIQLQVNGNENGIRTLANGATELYHNNVKQLETQSVGIKVAGHVHSTVTGSQISSGDPTGGNYLMLYHDGSNGFIQNGSGGLKIRDVSSGNIEIQATDGETSIFCGHNGAVELYHDNSKKFETTSSGIDITGKIKATSNIEINADNMELRVGASDDFKISHSSSENINILRSNSPTVFRNEANNETLAKLTPNGSVELYYDNSKKLFTTNTGIELDGNIQIPDGNEVKLGANGDLRMFHANGNANFIQSYNDNSLRIHTFGTSAQVKLQTNESENNVVCKPNGATELYHDNSKKIETASYGSRTTGYHSQSAPISWLAYGDSSWYTMTNGQSIYPFNFNNIAHNINGAYKNSGTDAGLFVAPIDGVYQFNYNIFCQGLSDQDTGATLEMYIRKNGNTVSYLHNKKGYGNMGDDQQVINLSFPLQLSANDKIGVIFSAYTITWRIYGGHSTFSGHLIG